MTGYRFDEAEFRVLAGKSLLGASPTVFGRGDNDLNPGLKLMPVDAPRRDAAVLVPVVLREPELTVILTQRTDHLPNHAGQISFPGGKLDPVDRDTVDAALREAEEETALSREFVEPLGFLDGYLTRTGFHIVPVVALVRPGFTLVPAAGEVAAVFEVPLRFLMTVENHARHSIEWKGAARHFYAMPYEDRYIWGATAGMLRNLYDRMYAMP
ncbi:CoA pyrophosphatase [soil metagenome]